MKTIFNKSFILGAIPLAVAIPVIVTSCSTNDSNSGTIASKSSVDDEVKRVNNNKNNITLKESAFGSMEEIKALNASNIKQKIKGITLNEKLFNYSVTNFAINNQNSEISFKFRISSKNNTNAVETDLIKLKYTFISIEDEVEKFNAILVNLQLQEPNITQAEFDSLTAQNIKDKIQVVSNDLFNDKLNYEVVEFDKTSEAQKIKFKFKISVKNSSTVVQNNTTNLITLYYKIVSLK